jgi:hypothetical protein
MTGVIGAPAYGVRLVKAEAPNCISPHSGEAIGDVQAEDVNVGHEVVLESDDGEDVVLVNGVCAVQDDP